MRNVGVPVILSAGIWTALSLLAAQAATVPAPNARLLIGTYQCVEHDDKGQTRRFSSRNSAWGAWVRVDTHSAPQNGQQADTAATFVGFDPASKRWNIVALDRSGSYYTRYSESRAFDGSRWIDGYPADGGKAIIRVLQNGYTFDLTAPPRRGSASRVHVVCTRV